MKKLIQINTVCNTSTGKLMGDIQKAAIKQGYRTLSIVGRRKPFSDMPCVKVGNIFSFGIHIFLTTVFDRQGFGSYFETQKIVKILKSENPDIIHLHNLHGYYLNLPVLFKYLTTEYKGKVFWTFHDCWALTGHCAYFTEARCKKWQRCCEKCPQKTEYPVSLFVDDSKMNYQKKKEMFTMLKHLTIVVPSDWMKEITEQSFMKKYPIKVVNNGIDMNVFKYTVPSNSIYERYGIASNKKIIIGVASIWDKRKGLDDFIRLNGVISNEYQIVVVGLKKYQIRELPRGMIGICHTESKEELAMLYSLAEVFLNPSQEESFSLVTAEALACGTPIIVLSTSAVKEFVSGSNGIVLEEHNPSDYLEAIRKIEKNYPTRKEVAASAAKYSVSLYSKRIMNLYNE